MDRVSEDDMTADDLPAIEYFAETKVVCLWIDVNDSRQAAVVDATVSDLKAKRLKVSQI